MNLYGHMRMAEEMEMSKGFVIQAQKRYLKDCIKQVDIDMQFMIDWVDGVFDINEIFALFSLEHLCRDKAKLKKEYERVVNSLKPRDGDITEEMIDTAKAHPVENLIDFRRGKAVAFCHEDRHPTMFHATRGNFARCPACDRNFNPIDVCIFRDGMSFIDAVKRLS